MKSILALALVLLTSVPSTTAAEKSESAPAPKKDCPLCKLPGRAALFAGKVEACPAGCARLCCTGTEVTFVVDGLVCDRCSTKVKSALAKIEGAHIESVSHQSGRAKVKYDPARVTVAQLNKAIVACGYKVSAQVVSFKLPGLINDAAASEVETALGTVVGIRKIETVCQKSGAAIVVFDPAKTDRKKIAAAINTTQFKVAN